MDALIAVGFFAGLIGVNFLWEYILKLRLGPERYEAYRHSAKRAAEVGVNQLWLKILNSCLLTLIGMVAIMLLPRFAVIFGVLTGLLIIILHGFLLAGVAVAVVLGWFLV